MAKKNNNIEDVEVEDTNQDYSSLVGGYNPFGESVVERDYTKPKQTLTSEQRAPIIEPTFEPPPIGGYPEEMDGEMSDEEMPGVFDESVNDLDEKDKQFAHENLVDTVLGGYEMMHTFARRWATLTEEKLIEKEKKGEIDLRMQIMVSPVQSLPLFEFVQNYNKQVEETLTVDEDFVEKVKPIMVRIAAKRGLGMTDEQNLMVMFGKDILEKGMQVVGFKKSLNNILELTYEGFKQQQVNNFNAPPQQGPPQQGPPSQGPPPQGPPPQAPPQGPPPEPQSPRPQPPVEQEELEDYDEYDGPEFGEEEEEIVEIRGVKRGELIEMNPTKEEDEAPADNEPKLIEPNANTIQESEEK
jgi:hypothetical protein